MKFILISFKKYNIKNTCCSDTFISFHRINPYEQLHFLATLNDKNFNDSFLGMYSKMNEYRNMNNTIKIN